MATNSEAIGVVFIPALDMFLSRVMCFQHKKWLRKVICSPQPSGFVTSNKR